MQTTNRPFVTDTGELSYSSLPLNYFGGMNIHNIQVLKSAAGYYIGDLYEEDENMWFPNSRDSQRYWGTREEAEHALITRNYEVKF